MTMTATVRLIIVSHSKICFQVLCTLLSLEVKMFYVDNAFFLWKGLGLGDVFKILYTSANWNYAWWSSVVFEKVPEKQSDNVTGMLFYG